VNSGGDIYLTDSYRIRKVTASTGIITTVAGNGVDGYSGDGKSAFDAELAGPMGVALDAGGNLFIADTGNQRIREVFAVPLPATSTSLTLSLPAIAYGGKVELFATVTGTRGSANPAGTVAFYANGAQLGTGALNSAGVTTYSTTVPEVGDYRVTAAYLGSKQYAGSTSTAQDLTVDPAVLTVKPNYARAIYGRPYPSFSYVVAGLKFGQTASVLSSAPLLTTTVGPGAGVGQYPISVHVTGVTAANYTVVAGPSATLSITPATLQVKALGTSVKQGAPIPSFKYALSGLTNGDTAAVVSGTPVITTTAVQGSPAGVYPIMVNVSGMSAANYNVTAGPNATLTIKP
jgi:hypothetical protein